MSGSAKAAFNIINSEHIHSYLREFARGPLVHDEKLAECLDVALARAIKKHPANLQPVHSLPEDAPDWLRKKWDGSISFHRFTPDKTLDDHVSHVRDWIKGAIVRGEEWLRMTDAKGRPKKLLKIGNIEQALREAEKDLQRQLEIQRSKIDKDMLTEQEIANGDILVIMTFPDGYKIVQMLTKAALDRETTIMGHCLGNGAYDDLLLIHNPFSTHVFYSLRDLQNQPHVSLDINFHDKSVNQCRGKQNRAPVEKYFSYIENFFRKAKIQIKNFQDGDLFEYEGRLYSIFNMPEGINYRGDFKVCYLTDFAFPKNLTIEGKLYINNLQRALIPPCLTLKGRMIVYCYDQEFNLVCQKEYFGLQDNLSTESWRQDMGYHRDDGPAFIKYSRTGVKVMEAWYRNGRLHREDGPAIIRRSPAKGEILEQTFWQDGQQIKKAG